MRADVLAHRSLVAVAAVGAARARCVQQRLRAQRRRRRRRPTLDLDRRPRRRRRRRPPRRRRRCVAPLTGLPDRSRDARPRPALVGEDRQHADDARPQVRHQPGRRRLRGDRRGRHHPVRRDLPVRRTPTRSGRSARRARPTSTSSRRSAGRCSPGRAATPIVDATRSSNANVDRRRRTTRTPTAYFRSDESPRRRTTSTPTRRRCSRSAPTRRRCRQPLFQYRAAATPLPPTGAAGRRREDRLHAAATQVDYDVGRHAAGLGPLRRPARPTSTSTARQIAPHERRRAVHARTRRAPPTRGRPRRRPVGSGDAWVFTDGEIIHGHVEPARHAKPATLTDGNGQPIQLTPGHTWVELPADGQRGATCPRPGRRSPAAATGRSASERRCVARTLERRASARRSSPRLTA